MQNADEFIGFVRCMAHAKRTQGYLTEEDKCEGIEITASGTVCC